MLEDLDEDIKEQRYLLKKAIEYKERSLFDSARANIKKLMAERSALLRRVDREQAEQEPGEQA